MTPSSFLHWRARIGIAASLLLAASAAMAQQPAEVSVERGWARPTVQGQSSSGAYMTLTAREGTQLVDISSPMAGVVEVHEMKMEGDVMKMRGVPALDLPAGRKVELKPGGYHVMVMDLKAPLVKGSNFPLTLTFRNSKGVASKLDVQLPVMTAPPAGAAAGAAMHDHAASRKP